MMSNFQNERARAEGATVVWQVDSGDAARLPVSVYIPSLRPLFLSAPALSVYIHVYALRGDACRDLRDWTSSLLQ